MLNVVTSTADEPNPHFVQTRRVRDEDNAAWLTRQLKELASEEGARGASYLVLLGGKMKADFYLRVAQGHMRMDMSPSHWSHVALLQGSGPTRASALWEISLEPKVGFGYPPGDNGVQSARFATYKSKNQYPNVSVMRIPVKLRDMRKILKRFKQQRREIDCVELTLLWLAYVWGVGRTVNPLLDGYGMPSAAFVEVLATACEYDLTPGLESRASCPEAIWQAARWWHEFHESSRNSAPIRGMWHLEHFLGQ